jgi:cytosine/adenosine deaminase-related metal-dependent hydrolase
MPNLHSHAFQRALAGRTGYASGEGDSFWTWRHAMYSFLDRIDADAFEAIAAQAYVEMLKAGYTSVAEFHYVHHDPQGRRMRMSPSLRIASSPRPAHWNCTHAAAGVLCALGFRRRAADAGQRRFVHTIDSYARLVGTLAREAATATWNVGVAPHSLRAVTSGRADVDHRALAASLAHPHPRRRAVARSRRRASRGAARGRSNGLLDHAAGRRALVRGSCDHMTGDETRRLASSSAIGGLAPTTEADLGDGTFRRARLSAALGPSASAATRTRASIPTRSCGSSSGRSASPAGAQRAGRR